MVEGVKCPFPGCGHAGDGVICTRCFSRLQPNMQKAIHNWNRDRDLKSKKKEG